MKNYHLLETDLNKNLFLSNASLTINRVIQNEPPISYQEMNEN